jgi:hypothetical protein
VPYSFNDISINYKNLVAPLSFAGPPNNELGNEFFRYSCNPPVLLW